MSEVIKRCEDRGNGHIVRIGDEYFYVDSCYSYDRGFETMVFACEKNGGDFEVTSWSELYEEYYNSSDKMRSRHNEIINNLEKYIEE